MAGTRVTDQPTTVSAAKLEDMYQVILYNDDTNTMGHVVKCLMQIFGHPEPLAVKIMLEAHQHGKAVAEVESESLARWHVQQLRSYGLTAEMEKL